MSALLLSMTDLLRKGRVMDREEYEKQAAGKLGTLRAGNSGIMSETGDIAAACHRKTLLRSLGVEIDPPDDSKQIMFQLGYASEDLFVTDIQKTLPPGHVILREADIPINWQTQNGITVTGRPDIVICRNEVITDRNSILEGMETPKTEPVLGVELKSVHSVWTARDVLFAEQPKLANIAQAAHYMWKLGIPYKLIYKSYSQLGQGMSWSPRMAALFPKAGEKYSEFLDYNDKDIPLQVKQFEIVYDLELDKQGRVKYKLETSDKWEHSLVTTGDIERYYEFISKMQSSGDLGPRPMNIDTQGNKTSFDQCEARYCPLSETCDKYESRGFVKWLAAVHKLQETSK